MDILKQSTTVTIKLGPFLDATDGVTEEGALTPGIEVSKAGGAFAARNSATAVAHDAEGWYDVELDATDTGTLGPLVVKAQDSANHLPVYERFMVVPAHVYDGLVLGTDFLQVDAQQVGGATPDTATDIADQTWDEARADHVAAGSMGENMGDQTNLSNLDAAVSSRSSHTTANVADKVLGRNISGGSDGGRTVTEALRPLRNRITVSGGTLTVYAEDDTTSSWTAAVTRAVADAISEVDPV